MHAIIGIDERLSDLIDGPFCIDINRAILMSPYIKKDISQTSFLEFTDSYNDMLILYFLEKNRSDDDCAISLSLMAQDGYDPEETAIEMIETLRINSMESVLDSRVLYEFVKAAYLNIQELYPEAVVLA